MSIRGFDQRKAAKSFADRWKGHGYEKGETQKFWIDLLANVFGVKDIARFIYFEEQVKDKIQGKTITNFIDAYIPSTCVMIEQKSSHKDLRELIKQSDGRMKTPFQQARDYISTLPLSQHPKWIVTCNFDEILIYDMENPSDEPQQIFLKDLPNEYYRLQFLVDSRSEWVRREEEISLRAGELVGRLYDAIYKEYIEPTDESLRSLNILCVRIVFCLYAEDAGLFDTKTSFEDYIKSFAPENLRQAVSALFKALDTPVEQRDKYDFKLAPFPYVNGGLFRDEQIEIPNFTQEIVDVIVNHCAPFNWSEISPTIFGAVFESTLNPETRRKGGMHYTSVANIHKVIDPLFLNDLEAEFQSITQKNHYSSHQKRQLHDFQKRLGELTFLDPACGSGNFLTETYISLRRLENKVISILNKGEKVLGFNEEFIKVNINQFYGIEINDFAVTVAKTAMWIAECQMAEETERLMGQEINLLPLKNHANIVEGNALRMNWGALTGSEKPDFLYAEKLNVYKVDKDFEAVVASEAQMGYAKHYKELNIVTKELEEKELPDFHPKQVEYDYIIGNPPFSGYGMQTAENKKDTLFVYVDENGRSYRTAGKIDYVANWYFKAANFIQGKPTRCAFVSTNSICQGEQVVSVWKPIFERFQIHIDFAYSTFKWFSESNDMAHVHCVVIGFSHRENHLPKCIFNEDGTTVEASMINPYLMDAEPVWIESRANPLCDVPRMTTGNRPADGGHLIIEESEYEEFIKKEPKALKWIKALTGAEEFIKNRKRYCLWLVGASPSEIKNMPLVYKRVQLCREDRLKGAADRQKLADTPAFFREISNPEQYLIIPRVSSEKRKYIPIGFLDSETIPTDSATIITHAGLYEFGVLTSCVHMAWMRVVCGRLKSDYRYSKDIVYNNFPWCNPTAIQKAKIEETAQGVLYARTKYTDSSLAELYDETLMPIELRNAHHANDQAVMEAYGFNLRMSEKEIVVELFRMYKKLIYNK